MMNLLLLLSVILVTVNCAPVPDELQETILSYEYNNDGSGNYNFRYSTSNGILREEEGTLVHKGESDEHIEVRGSYSYLRPDGKTEIIEYTADEMGFQYTKIKTGTMQSPSPALLASLLG